VKPFKLPSVRIGGLSACNRSILDRLGQAPDDFLAIQAHRLGRLSVELTGGKVEGSNRNDADYDPENRENCQTHFFHCRERIASEW
jgi:hypothetical protein